MIDEDKKNYSWLFIIFAIIVVALVVVGLWYYSEYNNTSNTDTESDTIVDDKENVSTSNDDVYVTEYDQVFLSLADEKFLSITPEGLITSSDSYFSYDYIGSMYSEDISDEYKVKYLLNYLLSIYNYDGNNLSLFDSLVNNYGICDANYNNCEFELSLDILNSIVNDKFSNTTISNGFSTQNSLLGVVNSVECTNDVCVVSVTYGVGGTCYPCPHYNSLFVSSDYDSDTSYYVYTYQSYYVSWNSSTSMVELYDTYNGTLINSLVSDELSSDFVAYTSYFTSIPTYQYTFDSNNVLINVERLY